MMDLTVSFWVFIFTWFISIYNYRTLVVEESIYVVFNESNPFNLQNTKDVGIDVILDILNINEDHDNTTIKDEKMEDP